MTTTLARLGLLATAALLLAAIPSPVSAASPASAVSPASAASRGSAVSPASIAPLVSTASLAGASLRRAPAARRSPGSAAAAEPPRSSEVARLAGTLETPSTGVWPLDPEPEVISGFDPPLSTYGSGHRGVDLAGTAGQEVRAAAGGRVTYAGSLAGRGVVVVSHGTTRTTYEPVEAGVKRGSIVTAGAVIGTLQSFGSHCAPQVCLHWGLIEGETYLDPLTLVGAGPVRLLPLVGRLPGADLDRGAPFVGQDAVNPSPDAAPGPGSSARFLPRLT